MNQSGNKAAKGFGYFLAVLIIICMISGVITAIYFVSRVAKNSEEDDMFGDGEFISETRTFADIEKLDIDASSFDVIVKGTDSKETVCVLHNMPDYIRVEESGSTLRVYSQKKINWFGGLDMPRDAKIEISVPRHLRTVKLDTGSGKFRAEGFEAETIEADTGSGALSFLDIVADRLVFDTGSGSVYLDNTKTGELVIDSGSGSVSYEGEINGDADIDSGSGNVSLKLHGKLEDYDIYADSGSGGIWINEIKIRDEFNAVHTSSNKAGSLRVGGGSGRVTINIE